MTNCVPEIQRFPDIPFVGILEYETILNGYRPGNYSTKYFKIGICKVVIANFIQMIHRINQSVFDHFSVSGDEILTVNSLQKTCVDQYGIGLIDHTNFIL